MSDNLNPEVEPYRHPNYPIHNLLLNRWSPRIMSGEEMSEDEFLPLFEAARWAPSSYNAQPWRFLYAKKSSPHWKTFFDLLVPANQEWAEKAALLVVLTSKTHFERNGKPSITHSFDAGAAWMSLALEGAHRDYVIHAMEGFDYDKSKKDLNIPSEMHVEAMLAIGKKPKNRSDVAHEEHPNSRRPINEILIEGPYTS
ncbi:MAG: hypothetical protein S4CHLAM7_12790 [Chlamydiae bacterium]|nr:hypothetical protein [Chlamydiota bacterium]